MPHCIYIRHGERKDNSLDSCLTRRCFPEIKKHTDYLIKTYGKPDFIVCSPYKRCQQTAMVMLSCQPKRCPVYYDERCAEYLMPRFDQKKGPPPGRYAKTTQCFKLPEFGESEARLTKRLVDLQEEWGRQGKYYWVVTHGRVVTQTMNLHRIKSCKVPFLGTLVLGDKDCEWRARTYLSEDRYTYYRRDKYDVNTGKLISRDEQTQHIKKENEQVKKVANTPNNDCGCG